MSTEAAGPRPRQVTIGGWLAAVSSAVLVVSVFDAMAGLHSLDTRERLTKALAGWPADAGISLGDAIDVTRGALFLTGVAAVVTGILGIFVLQRHATARTVMTIAAVPVVVMAPLAGGFVGLLVGGATVMLWTPEARDWFAGRAPRPRPSVGALPVPSAAPPTGSPQRSASPWGETAADRALWAPPAHPHPAAPGARSTVPPEVRFACVLTWVFSALTAGAYVLVVGAIAVDRGRVLELLQDNRSIEKASLGDDQLVGLLLAVSAVVIAWCVVASVLAALTWRRHHVAWVLLLAGIGLAGAVEVLALPYSLLHVLACAGAFVLLLRPASRSWVRREPGSAAPPRPRSWPGPPGPDQPPPGEPPVW
jgi:hypothetical protein